MAGATRRLVLLGSAGLCAIGFTPAFAAKAPSLGRVALQRPPDPYRPQADADADIAAAAARARRERKLLLVDMGGNWCPDCLVLAAVMELPQAKAFLDRHYVIVTVDVGRFDKNLQVPARYGVKLEAVPCVVVLDAKGKVLNKGQELVLGSAASMSPQAVLDQLAAWIP